MDLSYTIKLDHKYIDYITVDTETNCPDSGRLPHIAADFVVYFKDGRKIKSSCDVAISKDNEWLKDIEKGLRKTIQCLNRIFKVLDTDEEMYSEYVDALRKYGSPQEIIDFFEDREDRLKKIINIEKYRI